MAYCNDLLGSKGVRTRKSDTTGCSIQGRQPGNVRVLTCSDKEIVDYPKYYRVKISIYFPRLRISRVQLQIPATTDDAKCLQYIYHL